ncbi:MAG TPA: matrixin family metalloprotease [Fimbriimonadaceae bacterium]|nr:matrixin family metalloprotease [Fimbriimonadaceae bacterium]
MKVAADKVLRRSSRGKPVRALYRYLAAHGHLVGGPEGISPDVRSDLRHLMPEAPDYFGKDLEDSLAGFQAAFGLKQTGELDEPTKKLIQTPRCGVPDRLRPETLAFGEAGGGAEFVARCGWDQRVLRYFVAAPHPSLPPGEHERIFTANLAKWQAVANIQFQPGDASAEIQSRLFDFQDGCGGTLAYSYFPCDGSPAGHCYFDLGECFSAEPVTPAGQMDFESVCLHELGHALGLDHDPNNPQAVMYPFFEFGEQRRTLQAGDIAGVRSLYP